MLHRYLSFINEGSSLRSVNIYWGDQIKGIIEKDWDEISIKSLKSNSYGIKFKTVDDDYYQVLFDVNDGKEEYLMENLEVVNKFLEKFKTEFWNAPQQYVKNMVYDPKCLGDLEHVRTAQKYNM